MPVHACRAPSNSPGANESLPIFDYCRSKWIEDAEKLEWGGSFHMAVVLIDVAGSLPCKRMELMDQRGSLPGIPRAQTDESLGSQRTWGGSPCLSCGCLWKRSGREIAWAGADCTCCCLTDCCGCGIQRPPDLGEAPLFASARQDVTPGQIYSALRPSEPTVEPKIQTATSGINLTRLQAYFAMS